MKRIVLIRHGESQWNKENRFTGWTNVDLSEKGVQEAFDAGKILKENGFTFEVAYTSYLKRAIKTLNNVLDSMDLDWIPVKKTWRLNEKHYGMLQGLNKAETAQKYGDEQVLIWRRSFDVAPHNLPEDDPNSATKDARYALVPDQFVPRTEALKDCIERVMPYWECEIFPALKEHDNIVVVAHGNSLRGVVKNLKGISDADIVGLNIPTGVPLVYELDNDFRPVSHYYLGDQEALAANFMLRLRETCPRAVEERYKFTPDPEKNGYELLEDAGRRRGFLISGGEVDIERMAKVLLTEFHNGKLGRITLEAPPEAR